jgi:hypothetical protein
MSNGEVIRDSVKLMHGEIIIIEYRKGGVFALLKTRDVSNNKTLISLTQEAVSELISKLATVEGNLTPSKIL